MLCTGSSNHAAKIPEAPWYVSSNNDGTRKAQIIYDLMLAMGFSRAYAYMVSSMCFSDYPMLPPSYADAYARLSKV